MKILNFRPRLQDAPLNTPLNTPLKEVAFRLSPAFVPLPLLGRVAAGRPIETIETPYGRDAEVDVPASMVGNGDHFVLQVTGDSMLEEGILSGDYVVVKRQESARNGQTVVAVLRGEATVKRYFRRGDRVELQPANPEYRTIHVRPGEEFQIDGVVVGVIRHLEEFVGATF